MTVWARDVRAYEGEEGARIMRKYSVNFGVTYWVDADSVEEAVKRAEDAVLEDWGKAFYREAWMSDPEAEDEA